MVLENVVIFLVENVLQFCVLVENIVVFLVATCFAAEYCYCVTLLFLCCNAMQEGGSKWFNKLVEILANGGNRWVQLIEEFFFNCFLRHMKRTTTFVRKGAANRRQALPQGTKPSVHNGQLLISSGSHDFDST